MTAGPFMQIPLRALFAATVRVNQEKVAHLVVLIAENVKNLMAHRATVILSAPATIVPIWFAAPHLFIAVMLIATAVKVVPPVLPIAVRVDQFAATVPAKAENHAQVALLIAVPVRRF